MTKHNLVLTDLMHMGDHFHFESYWRFADLPNETFEYFANYYQLPEFDLSQYDRKIALINHIGPPQSVWNNEEYIHDVGRRIDKLHKLGFVFVIAHPWESDSIISVDACKNLLKNKSFTRWSGGVSFFWHMMYEKHRDKKFMFDHSYKKHDFLYLNKNAGRRHRKKLYDTLSQQQLLKNSLVSFIDLDIRLPEEYELPWVDRKNYPYRGMDQDLFEAPYNTTVCSIVSETNVGDDIFITEKIWKAIIAEHLFVVHGNNHYLSKLKQLGFKTFSDVFDETYDDETDENKKIKKIVETVQSITEMDSTELYQKTKEIRAHNRKLFFDVNRVKDVVGDSILGLLKFFDGSQVSS
jgi:hypothetical protein